MRHVFVGSCDMQLNLFAHDVAFVTRVRPGLFIRRLFKTRVRWTDITHTKSELLTAIGSIDGITPI